MYTNISFRFRSRKGFVIPLIYIAIDSKRKATRYID